MCIANVSGHFIIIFWHLAIAPVVTSRSWNIQFFLTQGQKQNRLPAKRWQVYCTSARGIITWPGACGCCHKQGQQQFLVVTTAISVIVQLRQQLFFSFFLLTSQDSSQSGCSSHPTLVTPLASTIVFLGFVIPLLPGRSVPPCVGLPATEQTVAKEAIKMCCSQWNLPFDSCPEEAVSLVFMKEKWNKLQKQNRILIFPLISLEIYPPCLLHYCVNTVTNNSLFKNIYLTAARFSANFS